MMVGANDGLERCQEIPTEVLSNCLFPVQAWNLSKPVPLWL